MKTLLKGLFHFLFSFCLCFSFAFCAEEIRVEAFVSPAFIHIGDSIHYHIKASFDPALKVDFPHFGDNLSGFAIREFSPRQESTQNGKKVIEETYELHTFVTGDYSIPPALIHYGDKSAEKTIQTGSVYVRVDSRIDSSTTDIKDIASPLSFLNPTRWKIWALWIGIPFCLVGLVIFMVRSWMQRKTPPQEDLRSPWEIALSDLESLKLKNLLEKQQFREHYFALSDILRNYIESRFELMAPERTTEEFIKLMRTQHVFSSEHQGLLHQFLLECDLVKFAKATPAILETDLGTERVSRFIQETIPVVVLPPIDGGKKI